jgi:serine acetyltransferase
MNDLISHETMNKRKYRDFIFLLRAILFCWIYIPHLTVYCLSKNKNNIDKDLDILLSVINIRLSKSYGLLYLLHNNSYFRTVFYYRIGSILSMLIEWYRPGCRSFIISKTAKIEGGILFAHPYSTILNAEYIGSNFSFRHLTTLGNKGNNSNRPIIGNNVTLGAAVTIIGKITVGNNVTVGAGAVVTKSIPDNCVVAGNPARIVYQNNIRVDKKL